MARRWRLGCWTDTTMGVNRPLFFLTGMVCPSTADHVRAAYQRFTSVPLLQAADVTATRCTANEKIQECANWLQYSFKKRKKKQCWSSSDYENNKNSKKKEEETKPKKKIKEQRKPISKERKKNDDDNKKERKLSELNSPWLVLPLYVNFYYPLSFKQDFSNPAVVWFT